MPSPESRVDLAQAADALASEVDRLLDHGRVDGDWTDLEGALDSLRSALRASTEGDSRVDPEDVRRLADPCFEHRFHGSCPDVVDPEKFDPECERCRVEERILADLQTRDESTEGARVDPADVDAACRIRDWLDELMALGAVGSKRRDDEDFAALTRVLAALSVPAPPTEQGGAEARSDRPAWGGIQVSPNLANYLDDPAPADPTPREGDAQVDLAERISEMAIEFGLLNSALAAEDWNAADEHLTALANLGLNDPRPLLARALTSEPAQPDQGSDPSRVDEADVEIVRHALRHTTAPTLPEAADAIDCFEAFARIVTASHPPTEPGCEATDACRATRAPERGV